MKEESKWPLGSYIASVIGAAVVVILKIYSSQRGGSHLSGGRILPIILALSPFLFAALVINLNSNPRAVKFLSIAIILQSFGATLGYYHTVFHETGLTGSLDLGLIPLYQFALLGITAGAVHFIQDKPAARRFQKK